MSRVSDSRDLARELEGKLSIQVFIHTHDKEFLSSGSFNILAYTSLDAEVPMEWIDSDARQIEKNAEQVKLRSFSTSRHKVEALVAYRLGEDS